MSPQRRAKGQLPGSGWSLGRQKHLTPTSYAGNARWQLETHPEIDWAVIHAQVTAETAGVDETAPEGGRIEGRPLRTSSHEGGDGRRGSQAPGRAGLSMVPLTVMVNEIGLSAQKDKHLRSCSILLQTWAFLSLFF